LTLASLAVNLRVSPTWALNSAVECHLHTVEVAGSNPAAPTNTHHDLAARVTFGFERGSRRKCAERFR
jgi:hypothetical protein